MLFDVLLDLEHSVSFIEVVGVSDRMGIRLIFWLDDHILHSSELDDASWAKRVA